MHNMMKLEYRLLVSLLYNYDEPSENIIRVRARLSRRGAPGTPICGGPHGEKCLK